MLEQEIGQSFKYASDAQDAIGLMAVTKSGDIAPCSDNGVCVYVSPAGCTKVLFTPSDDGPKEIGPFYDPDQKALVCPIQKGVISNRSNNGHKSE